MKVIDFVHTLRNSFEAICRITPNFQNAYSYAGNLSKMPIQNAYSSAIHTRETFKWLLSTT